MGKYSDPRALLFIKCSVIMSIIICCIGLSVSLGWMLDITLLKSILPYYIPMQPISAVMFILIGLSLLLQQIEFLQHHHYLGLIGKFFGILIAILGLLTLLDILYGFKLIHQLFFLKNQTDNVLSYPNTPSLIMGLNFLIIGLSLFFIDTKYFYFNQFFIILVGFSGLLILVGFTFSYNSSFFLYYSYSSIYSAICFLLISFSLFLMRPYVGIMKLFTSSTNGGHVARRLMPIVILLPILLQYLKVLGEHYEIYDTRAGMAFYSIFITAILIIVTFFISRRLMKSDSRRLKIEKELIKSNKEIEDLYNNAPCGYHSLDENGNFKFINTTELNWLGYQRAELIDRMNVIDIIAPSSKVVFQENFKNLSTQETIKALEIELKRKNGSTFTVLLNATIDKDSEGKYLMSHSTIFDISERKRIQQALRESEERFHNAMDTAPIGMAIISLNGKFVEVNQALCQLLGYSKTELENMTFQQITHPDDLAIDLTNSLELIEGKINSHKIEKRYLKKDASIIWVQLTASILRDPTTDKPLYFITQVEDITERKHVEDKIIQLAYYDSLTNLPNRRLLIDRLEQAMTLAERHQHMLAIMFMDLDKFKEVNDSFGHDIGDELLKAIAVRLKSELRGADTIARISGDEFVIVLNVVNSRKDVGIVAAKIIEIMRNRFLLLGHEINSSCSVGIVIYPTDGTKISDLMKKADTAMYIAKENGRNQYHFYQE